MEFELITKKQYTILFKIQKDNPILTFRNEGYQYIKKDNFTKEDKKAFDTVTSILRNHIVDFREFNNFRFNEVSKKMEVRFQYNYEENKDLRSFIGVGYLELDELLNGFNQTKKLCQMK